jgi:hypothetical protein
MFYSQIIALLRHFGPMNVDVLLRAIRLDDRD